MWLTNDSLVWHVRLIDSISPRLFLPNYMHKYAEKLVDMPNSDNLQVGSHDFKKKTKIVFEIKGTCTLYIVFLWSDAIYYSHLFLLFSMCGQIPK